MFFEGFRKVFQRSFNRLLCHCRSQWKEVSVAIKSSDNVRVGFLFTLVMVTTFIPFQHPLSELHVQTKSVVNNISKATIRQGPYIWNSSQRNVLQSWNNDCVLVVKLIIPPRLALKTPTYTHNYSTKLEEALQFLEYSFHSDYRVCIHFVLLPDEMKHINKVKKYLTTLKWDRGVTKIICSPTRNGLEIVSKFRDIDRDESSELMIMDLNYFTFPIRNDWYHYLQTQRAQFQNCHEIVSYSPVDADIVEELSKHAANSKDAILWQGAVQNGILIPLDRAVWNTFLSWLQSERGYWYLWPTTLEPKKRSDSRWNSFNASTVAPWTMWFSRFSVLYDVYTLYTSKDNARTFGNGGVEGIEHCHELRKVNLNGSKEWKSTLPRIRKEAISSIWRFSRKYNNTISLTIANEAFLETVKSWLCNVDEGGFRPPGLVWVALDNKSYYHLSEMSNSHTVRLSNEEGRGGALDFAQAGYWFLMLERAYLVRDLLCEGISIFLFETDQVWLRDPLPTIRRLQGNGNEVDLIATLDIGRELGGNFLFLNPSLPMRKLYREVCRRFENKFRMKNVESWHSSKRVLIGNDQTILTHLALYDQLFKRKFPIVLRVLDQDLFVCGNWYRNSSKYNNTRARSPIMINNNWISGVENKKQRLISFGHWFLSNGTCNSTLVRSALEENEQRLKPSKGYGQIRNSGSGLITATIEGVDSTANSSFVSNKIEDEISSP